ncbi:MAG: radical SAM protein [Candidatus Gracilibacteria bacterium]|nr:radical SAM protein [Candidatus Gracilibacteria bacterium]
MFKIEENNSTKNFEIISIELTHLCNLKCEWCFNQHSSEYNNKKFLNFEELIKTLLLFEKWRIKNAIKKPLIKLTGGEPTLYYRINELILFIKSYLGYKIKLNTNGLLLHKLDQKIISDNLDIILFSYHFGDNTMYNKSYIEEKDKAAKFISGLANNITKVICSRININLINNLEEHIKYIEDNFNFKRYILWFPLLAKGEKLEFSKEDYISLYKKIIELKKKVKIEIEIGFSPAFCMNGEENLIDSVTSIKNLITFSGNRINITPSGFLTDSYYYTDDKIRVKNINAFDEFFNSNFFKKNSKLESLPEKCKNCNYLQKCGGGNRMLTYMQTGDFYSPDPWMSE